MSEYQQPLPTEQEPHAEFPIRFEPGSHVSDMGTFDSIQVRLAEGDLDAHGWPDAALLARLKENPPQVLAIDGMRPRDESTPLDADMLLGLWEDLPLRPLELNAEGKVKILAGDSGSPLHYLAALYVGGYTYSENLRAQEPRSIGTRHGETHTQTYETAKTFVGISKLMRLVFIGTGISVLGKAVVENKKRQKSLGSESTPDQRQISRRAFLKHAAVATAAVGLGVPLANAGETAFEKEQLNALVRDIAPGLFEEADTAEEAQMIFNAYDQAIQPSLLYPEDTEVYEGATKSRTAGVVLKMRELYTNNDELQQAAGAIVFGDGHVWDEVHQMIEDPTKAEDAMKKSFTLMMDRVDTALEKSQLTNKAEVRERSRQILIEYMSRYEVFEVTDPKVLYPDQVHGSNFPALTEKISEIVVSQGLQNCQRIIEVLNSVT